MNNIIDYLNEYGKYSFNEVPFNDIDGLLLSQLTYQGFDTLAPELYEKKKYLQEFLPLKGLVEDPRILTILIENTLAVANNKKMLKALVNSKRYDDISINYFKSKTDEATHTQFAAMVFQITNKITYIGFRGTDATILGWHEDFNMALYDEIPSQTLAVEYLNDVLPLIDKHNTIYVGGHSKGGNLARYASIFCNPHYQKRIDTIFDNDGPGIQVETADLKQYQKIKDRIHKKTPGDSLIGILLKFDNNFKVVKSNSVSIFQHDPYNWNIDLKKGDFVYLDKTGYISKVNELALNKWIDSLNTEQREKIINVLFKIMENANIKTVPQIGRYPITSLYRAIISISGLNKEEKYLLTRTVSELASLWVKTASKTTNKKEKLLTNKEAK